MIANRYTVGFGADFQVFEFDSKGPKGIVRKIAQYTEIENGIFNLGFGDKHILTNDIDDLVVTNNNDSQKVLATVAATLFQFTDHHPDVFVVATGSTLARTRLHRIGITNNLDAIVMYFWVYGFLNNQWHIFKKGVAYDAFLVKRKATI